MAFVTYTGRSDLRVLGAKDFKSLGVEQNKTEFRRGEKVEVPDAVAQVLTTHSATKTTFQVEENPVELTSVDENPEVDTDKSATTRKSR